MIGYLIVGSVIQQIMRLLVFPLILILTSSLYIPLASNQERCMVAFSFGQAETLKLQLRLPQVPKQDDYGEVYTISLRNSETNETQYQNVKYGVFKRELNVQAQVIYHICFKLASNRVINGIRVQYSAVTEFYYTPVQMNIPENLLKQKDLAETYRAAREAQGVAKRFQQMQQKRTQNEELIFAETKKTGNRLVKLSVLELIGIFVLAAMQLYVIRGFFTKRIVI